MKLIGAIQWPLRSGYWCPN